MGKWGWMVLAMAGCAQPPSPYDAQPRRLSEIRCPTIGVLDTAEGTIFRGGARIVYSVRDTDREIINAPCALRVIR